MTPITENTITAVGRALLAYRPDLTSAELVGMAHDAIAALNRLERGDNCDDEPAE